MIKLLFCEILLDGIILCPHPSPRRVSWKSMSVPDKKKSENNGIKIPRMTGLEDGGCNGFRGIGFRTDKRGIHSGFFFFWLYIAALWHRPSLVSSLAMHACMPACMMRDRIRGRYNGFRHMRLLLMDSILV